MKSDVHPVNIQILHRHTGAVLYEREVLSGPYQFRCAVELALQDWADLRHADFREKYLEGADLSGQNLSGVDFSDANLNCADFDSANCSGADFSHTNITWTTFRGAYLRDAKFCSAYVEHSNFIGADLTGCSFRGAHIPGADFQCANTTGADFEGVTGVFILGGSRHCATREETIANLDRVREIILNSPHRLEMRGWHEDFGWQNRTPKEEALCDTTHCLGGWLQVCSIDPDLRAAAPVVAATFLAPIAAKMFYKTEKKVLEWLRERKYVEELDKLFPKG